MKTANKALIFGWLLLTFPAFSSAQENWGPPEYVQIVAGCSYLIANPCFYDTNHYCYESLRFDDDYCRLGYGDFHSGADPVLIPGDSLNLPGYNYLCPFVAAAFDRLYFSSDIPGGYGGFDIWVSNWEDLQWGPPRNLGPGINTAANEFGPSLTGLENEIYFYRSEADWFPYGLYEISGTIHSSERLDNTWSQAEELPLPINVNGCSFEPSISSDGLKLYFCSCRPNISDHRFAYVSQRSGDNWLEPELLNSNINRLVSQQPWYDDSSGDVYSFSLDNSGTSALFTHYACYDQYLEGQIRISNLWVGIDEVLFLPEADSFSCYPNPFNSQVVFNIQAGRCTDVDLAIYDICGRKVASFNDGNLVSGKCELFWKPVNLSSGVYFAKLMSDGHISSLKVIYFK